jgi:hypothetical protein
MALIRRKMISKWLAEMLEEIQPGTTDPKNKIMAKILIDTAMNEKESSKLRLDCIFLIMERLEGKAVQPTADVTENPFADIDTAKLIAMKEKMLSEIEGDKK